MTDDMLHVMKWHNGEKELSPFTDTEMARRQSELRGWMAKNDVDAALFTSYHCINYYSGWLSQLSGTTSPIPIGAVITSIVRPPS